VVVEGQRAMAVHAVEVAMVGAAMAMVVQGMAAKGREECGVAMEEDQGTAAVGETVAVAERRQSTP
jgi:hypothetical protein